MTSRPIGVKTIALAAAILLALGLSSCGDDDSSPSTGDDAPAATGLSLADLDGRQFATAQVAGHALVDETVVRLGFDGDQVSVDAGCNHMTGVAAIDGDRLSVTNLAGTEIGCEKDRADQDAWISGFLADGPTIALDGATLTLGEGDVTMDLAEQAVQETPSGEPGDTVTSNG